MGGVFYLLFSRAGSLAAASACVVGAHMGGSTVWVFSTTLLHLNTEDRFRGRVFAADFGLNMLAASLAVNELLARLHPFREECNSAYASVIFSLSSMELMPEPEEDVCGILGGKVGIGDRTPLLGLPELSERRAA